MAALHPLSPRHSLRALLAAALATAFAATWLPAALAATAPRGGERLSALLQSRELWATVDVCNPKDQPNTIGIRGSMPGDGNARDVMYMRFRVQYYDLATKRWTDPTQGADSGLQKVGSGDVARQAGRSFQFARTPGKPAFRMRGVIVFQWRHGSTVLATATRPTAAGHRSLAGADPRGYSAGTCKLE